MNEDDSGVIFQAGYRDNILVDLSCDPDIPLLTVCHDVAQQIARVSPEYRPIEFIHT
jgi:hypothetical protein